MSLRAISTFAIDTTDTTQYPNVNVKAYLCTVNCNNVAISAIRKLIISAQEREQLSMDYTFIRDNHVVTINYCIVIKRHIQPYCCTVELSIKPIVAMRYSMRFVQNPPVHKSYLFS